jgi:hypothetical protein
MFKARNSLKLKSGIMINMELINIRDTHMYICQIDIDTGVLISKPDKTRHRKQLF